jgi:hypothetical protein
MLFLCSRNTDNLAGTATDVNTGSIKGCVYNDKGTRYQDSVVVGLYHTDEKDSVTTMQSLMSVVDGNFKFDSLQSGRYLVKVMKNNVVVGIEKGIQLENGQNLIVNIYITIIINQYFTVTYNNVIMNTIIMVSPDGTSTISSDGTVKLTFTERDTVLVKALRTNTTGNDTIALYAIRQSDSSYKVIPVNDVAGIQITNGMTVRASGSGSDSTLTNVKIVIHEEAK